MIRIFIKYILFSFTKLLYQLAGVRLFFSLFDKTIDSIQDVSDFFITFHKRPKFARLVHCSSNSLDQMPKFAIIIQGPIILSDGFTFETLKFYRNEFPKIDIILSTWEDQPSEMITKIRTLGIIVILNNKPQYCGIGNINYQIVSSYSGIKKAHELNAIFVIKTRTDQRLYSCNFFEYLYNITQHFPISGNWEKQKYRIVGSSLNTYKYRLYGLSDMVLFGHIDDMLNYWNVNLDPRMFDKITSHNAGYSMRNFSKWNVCEVFLVTEFLNKIGRNLEWTLKDSWLAYKDHFCVIDSQQLDLFWNKYSKLEYRWLSYSGQHNLEVLTFSDWFNLINNIENIEINENILDIPLGKLI